MGDCESTYHSDVNMRTLRLKACENELLVIFGHIWLIFKEVWLLFSHSSSVIVVLSVFSSLSSASFALREIFSRKTHQHTVPSCSTYTFFIVTHAFACYCMRVITFAPVIKYNSTMSQQEQEIFTVLHSGGAPCVYGSCYSSSHCSQISVAKMERPIFHWCILYFSFGWIKKIWWNFLKQDFCFSDYSNQHIILRSTYSTLSCYSIACILVPFWLLLSHYKPFSNALFSG